MRVVRRQLFWKIYATLLVSLVVANMLMGAFFWFLDEAQREANPAVAAARGHAGPGPSDVTLFAKDGRAMGSRGTPIALSDYEGHRHFGPRHVVRIELPDGGFALARMGPPARKRALWLLEIMLAVAGGVGLAAYPVTALLTRRLEALRAGVARWGDGAGPAHLDERGSDEVALLARTFNSATGRLDALLASQKALLANASHELRSPLARLRMAIEVGGTAQAEIVQNLAEMDELVDELLLSSRLDHLESRGDRRETIDLLGLAAEEAARYDAIVTGEAVEIDGDAVLLRRLIRNLLDNGMRHGRPPIMIAISRNPRSAVLTVADAGDGIAPHDRERIFEPFYRPAGSRESAGGWGLGLALVRQIAERHGGSVSCRGTPAGGSVFVVHLVAGRPGD